MDEWPPWPKGLGDSTLPELDKTVKAIGCTYEATNKSAAINLFLHRAVALIIAIAGTYAVLVAILQLYDPKDSAEVTEHAELAFAIAAGIAVLIGLSFGFTRQLSPVGDSFDNFCASGQRMHATWQSARPRRY